MVTDFSPGLHSREDYERRRDSCTREELNKLFATPEFQAWCQGKAKAGQIIRWDVVGGASLVTLYSLCTLLVLLLGGRADTAPAAALAIAPLSVSPLAAHVLPLSNSTVVQQSNFWHVPLEVRHREDLSCSTVKAPGHVLLAQGTTLCQGPCGNACKPLTDNTI
jgi:hypothetical protein